MRFLQKFENKYFAAAHLLNVMLTLAVLMLVALFVALWLQAKPAKPWEASPQGTVKIDPASVIGDVLAKSKGSTILPSDPNAAAYEQIQNRVIALDKSFRIAGAEPLDYKVFGRKLINSLMYGVNDPQDTSAYWTGFAELLAVADKNEFLLRHMLQQIHAEQESTGEGAEYSVATLIDELAEHYRSHFSAAKDQRDAVQWASGKENDLQRSKALGMLSTYCPPFVLLILMLQSFTFARIAQKRRAGFCSPCDQNEGKIPRSAARLFRAVISLTVLLLASVLVLYWVQWAQIMTEYRKREASPKIQVKINPGRVIDDILALHKGRVILPSDPDAKIYQQIQNAVIALEKSQHIPGADPFDYHAYAPEFIHSLVDGSLDAKDLSAYLAGFVDLLEAAAQNKTLLQQIHAEGETYYSVTMLITSLAENYRSQFMAAKNKRDWALLTPDVENEQQQSKAFGVLSLFAVPFAGLFLILQTFIFVRVARKPRPADKSEDKMQLVVRRFGWALLLLAFVLMLYWVSLMQAVTQKNLREIAPESLVKIDLASVMGDVLASSKGRVILPSNPNAATYERIQNEVLAIEKSHRLPGDEPLDYKLYNPELVSRLTYDLSYDSADPNDSAYLKGFADLLEASAKDEAWLQQIHAASEAEGEAYAAPTLIMALATDYEKKYSAAQDKRPSTQQAPEPSKRRQEKNISLLFYYAPPFSLLILLLQTFTWACLVQKLRPILRPLGEKNETEAECT